MAKHSRRQRDERTLDLFAHERLFPVAVLREATPAADFNMELAAKMSRALTEAAQRGKARKAVASEMSEVLGRKVTLGMLNAYTAPSRGEHNISLVRFVAFARATECTWLWADLLEREGLTVLRGPDALLAQATYARKMADHYAAEAKRLMAKAPLAQRHEVQG